MAKTFTYVGSGDTPPHMTRFMGKIDFRRGEAVEVKDDFIIKKLEGHPCFTEGKTSTKEMQDNDEKAEKKRRNQQSEDIRVNQREMASRK